MNSTKLILIAAPAGFGKTTAISSWAQQNERRAAWVSMMEKPEECNRLILEFFGRSIPRLEKEVDQTTSLN